MRILIIEDEIKAAKELVALLHEIRNDVTVCGVLQSIDEAIHWFSNNKMPDLIISDISLADGSSFEIFSTVSISAPIIFCTAFNEYALQAFENNGFDYLLKPIEKGMLEKSFEKLKTIKGLPIDDGGDYMFRLNKLVNQFSTHYKSSILTYFRGIITPISTSNIIYIYADKKSNFAITAEGKYELNDTLDSLMETLNPNDFYRGNRQHIVHRKSILKIETLFTRKLVVTLKTPNPLNVVVSKAKASEFLKWLEGG